MTLDEATRQQIIDMAGMPVREIAESLHVSPTTVSSVLKAAGKSGKKGRKKGRKKKNVSDSADEIPAHAHAPTRDKGDRAESEETVTKIVTKKCNKTEENVTDFDDPEEVDRDALAHTTLSNLDLIVTKCLKGIERAKSEDQADKRAWQEIQYLKLIKDVCKITGSYAGLDNPPPVTTPTSPLDDLAKVLEKYVEDDE